jgi:hypothetical protein
MSLATFITAAITKVSTDETYANMEFATAEEARGNFTAALLFELGLGPKPSAVHATVEGAPKKKRAAKKSQPAAVAEAAVAILEQVKEVDGLAEEMGKLALDEQPKPKKARKAAATEEAPAEKKKPGPKPKAKPEGPMNLEKMNPTQKKHLKKVAEELKVEPKDKEFLTYANEMSAEEWGMKTLDEHIRAFLMPTPPPLAAPPKEFIEVGFDGTDYLVDPETKFVYPSTDGVVRKQLGIAGQGIFAQMDLTGAV